MAKGGSNSSTKVISLEQLKKLGFKSYEDAARHLLKAAKERPSHSPTSQDYMGALRRKSFNSIGQLVHAVRSRAQLDRSNLGRALGYSSSYRKSLKRVESGKTSPTPLFLRRLINHFKLDSKFVGTIDAKSQTRILINQLIARYREMGCSVQPHINLIISAGRPVRKTPVKPTAKKKTAQAKKPTKISKETSKKPRRDKSGKFV